MCGHFISALLLFPFFLDFLFQVQNALFYDSYSFLVFFPGFPGRIVKPPVLFVSGLHGRAGYAAAHENDDVRRRSVLLLCVFSMSTPCSSFIHLTAPGSR